ncbi:MAG TPA: hypothetical protein PKY99_11240, partial [Turneriella sp.]|nr:hypothetical protein [Turneriella sp.]
MGKNTSLELISPIAIDLGAKNTGVLIAQGGVTASPDTYERLGCTFVFPEVGLELSQKNRLAKRHQRRGFKRRRLSKRLLQLVLKQIYAGAD